MLPAVFYTFFLICLESVYTHFSILGYDISVRKNVERREEMFGYIICNKRDLTQEQKARYQSFYCGLCRKLKSEFGEWERLSLNYDMTFLSIFLSALYEPEPEEKEFRCSLHPFHHRNAVTTKYTDYAADMTILLAYHKCKDDWQDEKKKRSYRYGEKLQSAYDKVKERYPRQCKATEQGLADLNAIEKSRTASPDEAMNCFGRVMAELLVCEEDFWSNSLRAFGYDLGRFIYLMDAVTDYKLDMKKDNYNPLFRMNKKPEEMKDMLEMLIGNATQEFEKLPILQDAELLRNILYDGVWQRFYLKVVGKEKKDGRRSV